MPQVVWLTPKVHNGKDEDAIWFNTVENAVRKPTDKTPSNRTPQYGPRLGKPENPAHGSLDLQAETFAQARLTALVVGYGLMELLFRFGVKANAHFLRCSLASAKISSAGTARTLPARSSSSLRSATSAHFLSISASG